MSPFQVDPDLAAALFYTMGFQVPHRFDREEEARRLAESIPNKEKRLLKVVSLCGVINTPREYYLALKAYSWLGAEYREEVARYAVAYLNTPGWSELPHSTVTENGILVDQRATVRASVLVDLAQAQDAGGKHEAAVSNFMEAYRLEPYNAMHVIKAADIIERTRGREEALQFLLQQKSGSSYYTPVKYKDGAGNVCRNDTFKRLLDAHIRKLTPQE